MTDLQTIWQQVKNQGERIKSLESQLAEITGRPEYGPITMTEARIANERGDKATVARFNAQENERISKQTPRPSPNKPAMRRIE